MDPVDFGFYLMIDMTRKSLLTIWLRFCMNGCLNPVIVVLLPLQKIMLSKFLLSFFSEGWGWILRIVSSLLVDLWLSIYNFNGGKCTNSSTLMNCDFRSFIHFFRGC